MPLQWCCTRFAAAQMESQPRQEAGVLLAELKNLVIFGDENAPSVFSVARSGKVRLAQGSHEPLVYSNARGAGYVTALRQGVERRGKASSTRRSMGTHRENRQVKYSVFQDLAQLCVWPENGSSFPPCFPTQGFRAGRLSAQWPGCATRHAGGPRLPSGHR